MFKAVLALVIGFVIGLLFAAPIVRAIERPLRRVLENFYQDEAMEFVNARVPPEMQDNKAIKDLVYTEGLLPVEWYVSPVALLDALRAKYPTQFGDFELPGPPAKTDDKSDAAGTASDKGPPPPREYSRDEMIRLFVWRPMADDERLRLDALGVQEPFVIYIKAGFLAGAVISSPAVFYFLWQFVAAGLYPHEKRYIHVFLPFSLALFLTGAALAFFFVFPPVLNFFFGIAESMGTEMRPRLSEWLSFVLLLPLGFGVSFQLPLVMLFLERIHVFTVQTYLSKWRIAVLIMAIVAMVLSPGGDPYSMLMMLVPLVGLYFSGIALCNWLPNRRAAQKPLAGTRS